MRPIHHSSVFTSTRVGTTHASQNAKSQVSQPKPAQSTNAKTYNPRHPERTLLYKTVAEHFETWLELASAGQFDGQGDHPTPAPYVEKAFRKYLDEAFASAESAGSVNAPSITFHPAQIDEAAITKMQAQVQALKKHEFEQTSS